MIYFDNSATSRFKPYEITKIVTDAIANSCNAGRSGHDDSIALGRKIFGARESIKRFLNAGDEYEIIFTSNCSEALNLAIFGYVNTFNSKIHVVSTLSEHNSVLRPLRQLELSDKINTTYIPPNMNGIITTTALDGAIIRETKLVIINHTSNVTGATSDIHELTKVCKARNVALLVDGAQSLGHTKVDLSVTPIDFLAGAGHKGLHGIQGVGFLALKRNMTLKPLKFGGTGTSSESVDQPIILPESLECGTQNSIGILALECGVNWTNDNFDNLHHTYRYLASELHYGLRHIPGVKLYSEYPSSVISFNVKDYSSSEVADYLNTQGIAVRGGLHCAPFIHRHLGTLSSGAVRISIGYNNNIKDVKLLLKSIENLIKM